MRNFKPERSSREEPFIPGVDPGVKNWLKVRQAGRDAQQNGNTTKILTCDIKYKQNQYWKEELHNALERLSNVTEDSSDAKDPRDIVNSAEDSVSLAEFRKMLESRSSYEDILTRVMQKRNPTFVQLALKHGIHVDHKIGHLRRTMLHFACKNGDAKRVTLLLSLGADVNKLDFNGATPLHLSIQTPSTFHPIGIIEELLEYGCKINIQDKQHGHTALHLACILASKDIMGLLFKHHALPFIRDNKNKLAFDYTKGVSYVVNLRLHKPLPQFHFITSSYCMYCISVIVEPEPLFLRVLGDLLTSATPGENVGAPHCAQVYCCCYEVSYCCLFNSFILLTPL